ncbi:MAG TPA: flagellar hook-basal body complex protein [Hyphomicrobiales bacterium]|nr:flagellar hook-basal body complex protein [Hyphomicrobiales bacterium]
MGIFGALTTAVSGMQAQSYALQNISGNIANSQTVAFKRTDTNFTDLIPDALPTQQVSGAVLASSRATNNVQGDIQTSSNSTYMALNGDGYFVVSQATGTVDGQPVFGGTDLYTRRGDFQVDKNGYLVNGAGYYLKALPVDRVTGNVTGSVPQVIQLTNDILPAKASGSIEYEGNLPALPATGNADATVPGSEIFTPVGYVGDPRTADTAKVAATATGSGITDPTDLTTAGPVTAGNTLTLSIGGGTTETFTIGTGTGQINSLDDLVSAITKDTNLAGLSATNNGGQLQISADNINSTFTIGGTGATQLGLTAGAVSSTMAASPTGTVAAQDEANFLTQSISGNAITLYDSQGGANNVQFRWAKVNDASTGGTDTWNLFYLSNDNATGTQAKWTNVGTDFTFDGNGQLTPSVSSITLPNLTVDGNNLGNINMTFGQDGLTQFADANGTTNLTTLSQNGYAAGTVTRVSIGNNGRLTAFYSNGQMADILDIPTVTFTAENSLKQVDGGAYAATSESGQPISGSNASVVGGSLENSNTDISDEFSKLIVTQQAYSANTRIITAANSMMQDVLDMVR